jgi:hypothetical protein
MKEIILSALYLAARQLAGALLPRIIQLISDAQAQFGSGTGADKKAWVMDRIKLEVGFFGSTLWSLAPVVMSAVVDVIVAWVKTRSGQ